MLAPVLGVRARIEKPSLWAIAFQVFSTIQGKTIAKAYLSLLLRGLEKLSLRSCAKPAYVAESGPRASKQSKRKKLESGASLYSQKVIF